MIKLKLITRLYQIDGGDISLVQIENELGVITDSKAQKLSLGLYNLYIPNGFKDAIHVFCPQHRSCFNVVGSAENTFIMLGEKQDDSNYQIQILDQNLQPFEDSLSKIPFELYVYKTDFVPVPE